MKHKNTKSQAVARIADRTAWQHASGGGGVVTLIMGEQVSVGGRRWCRWIGRLLVPIGCQ